MFGKLLGFALTALPGVAGFMVYGLTQKKMGPVASAALAGAAFAATDIAGSLLSGGIAGVEFEDVGYLTQESVGSLHSRLKKHRENRKKLWHNAFSGVEGVGYLTQEAVNGCFGQC